MKIRIDLKILIFLVLFYFTNQLKIYLVIMLFCFIHELGHIFAGLIFNMKIEKLEIMPFGFSVSFEDNGTNNFKNIFVAAAGPLVTLAIIFIFFNLKISLKQEIIYSNILILIYNLMPIYPLDGGRIIKGILQIKEEEERAQKMIWKLTKITMIIITFVCSIAVYYFKNIAIFLSCIFLWIIILRIEEKRRKLLIFSEENSKIYSRKAGKKWENQQ